MKPITPTMHGVLDYFTSSALIAAPRMLGWSDLTRQLLTASAFATIGYSALTRYPLGMLKLLPMRTHLALDMASGALLCGASLLVHSLPARERASLMGIGLYELGAVALSQGAPPRTKKGTRAFARLRS